MGQTAVSDHGQELTMHPCRGSLAASGVGYAYQAATEELWIRLGDAWNGHRLHVTGGLVNLH
jgi:hypothetical protein